MLARLARAREHPEVRSLYLHVPFCFHKCHYCDFYSLVDNRDRQEPFVERLRRELAALAPLAAPLETIFVGGGTPTLLAPERWRSLLEELHGRFDLSAMTEGGGEFSVECNPETATAELFDVLRAGSVNRLSMGAQSFEPRHLKTLERWHDPDSVERAVGLARAAGIERLSVDLIFAVPGQRLEEWARDLERALALGVTHLSCYALTYEPNTAMTARLGRGDFEPCDPDLEADMYELTVERCARAGFDRYEVSNFAAPGAECLHNLAYWRQSSWLAAGPSASAHLLDPDGGSWRWKNVPRLDDYLRSSEGGVAPVVDHESPDVARLAGERLMTGVRLREGVDVADATSSLDPARRERVATCVSRQIEAGHLIAERDRVRPTESGFLVADGLARDLLEAVG